MFDHDDSIADRLWKQALQNIMGVTYVEHWADYPPETVERVLQEFARLGSESFSTRKLTTQEIA